MKFTIFLLFSELFNLNTTYLWDTHKNYRILWFDLIQIFIRNSCYDYFGDFVQIIGKTETSSQEEVINSRMHYRVKIGIL